jgi:phage terminase Nu1 subunit (DNA packaging protein)
MASTTTLKSRKHWSVNALSLELGIDRQTLTRRLKDAVPAETKQLANRTERRYLLADVVQALIDAQAESGDPITEKTRLDAARADQIEFDLAIKRGEYAPIEVLTFAVSEVASQSRSILEGLPKRIKNSLPALRAREMKIIETEINKVRKGMSEIQIDFGEDR